MSAASMSAASVQSAPDPLEIGASALKARLRRAERMGQMRAYALILPLIVFLLLTFVGPIANLLQKSVKDTTVSAAFPSTSRTIGSWEPKTSKLPPEQVFKALADDFVAAKGSGSVNKAANRLNFESAGMRSLLLKTARQVEASEGASWQERLTDIDPRWAEPGTWVALKYASQPTTLGYYLKAFDLTRDDSGEIVQQPEEQRLYRDVFLRTVWVSACISLLCLLIAYPVAYMLAALPPRISNVLMILVLLPFWTSFLVRTISWMVILQTNGVFNGLLAVLGISETGWTLIYNRWGVLISMTHILMPYAILSLYSVMKNIPPIYMRASRSLGAGPILSFFKVYFPHTLPGVAAAVLLTFILAVGYYITPAILGGANDQLISYYIANHVNTTLNWGLAAALATLLLVGVLMMYAVFVRLTGGSGVKLG